MSASTKQLKSCISVCTR